MAVKVMGVSAERARTIATANQHVDDDFGTASWNLANIGDLGLHFASAASARRIVSLNADPERLSDSELGAYLHSLQDVDYAHRDMKPNEGHLDNPEADNALDPLNYLRPVTVEMIIHTYEVMVRRTGGKARASVDEVLQSINEYVQKNQKLAGIDKAAEVIQRHTRATSVRSSRDRPSSYNVFTGEWHYEY